MKKNIKDKLRNNQIVSGWFIGTHSTYLAEIAGHIGFDFILIDNEHGAFSWGEVEEMIRAIDTTDSVPFVRVPSSSSVDILKALDRGAQGIHVPQVETAEEVDRIISAAKYPPQGTRGAAFSVRAAKYGLNGGEEHLKKSNENIFITVQLENSRGINNADSIMKKDVDMIYIGPTDLSVSSGKARFGVSDPEIKELIDYVFQTGKKNDTRVGMHIANSTEWQERKEWGASYMGISINAIINPAMKNYIQEIKK